MTILKIRKKQVHKSEHNEKNIQKAFQLYLTGKIPKIQPQNTNFSDTKFWRLIT